MFMMKKLILILVIASCVLLSMYADNGDSLSLGVHAAFGGRYDDLRMCVGSPPGVKGGPIGEIYLDIRIPAGPMSSLTVNLPVMRPILFAAAFKMLQFEPQVTWEYTLTGPGSLETLIGGGLGVSLHYGPDYTSSMEDPGESFFAAGPFFSGSVGLVLAGASGTWMPGIKLFYTPLFSSGRSIGTVVGGVAELHFLGPER
ncbi:MAG: hypothetical protein JW760_00475 [Spirochaetales bacterium]|nr:hypothetical protein [Spirochaetales bacterium]